MNITMKQFARIADKVCENYEEEIIKIYKKMAEDIIVEMYNNDLPVRDYNNGEKTSWCDSFEWIMMIQRVEAKLGENFILNVWMYQFNEIIDKLENRKNNRLHLVK
jgi:hypothetical protein